VVRIDGDHVDVFGVVLVLDADALLSFTAPDGGSVEESNMALHFCHEAGAERASDRTPDLDLTADLGVDPSDEQTMGTGLDEAEPLPVTSIHIEVAVELAVDVGVVGAEVDRSLEALLEHEFLGVGGVDTPPDEGDQHAEHEGDEHRLKKSDVPSHCLLFLCGLFHNL